MKELLAFLYFLMNPYKNIEAQFYTKIYPFE